MIKKEEERGKFTKKNSQTIWRSYSCHYENSLATYPTKKNCVPVVAAVWFWYSSNQTEHWRILIWEWTKKYILNLINSVLIYCYYKKTVCACMLCVKIHNGAKTRSKLPLNSYSQFLLCNGQIGSNQQPFFVFLPIIHLWKFEVQIE